MADSIAFRGFRHYRRVTFSAGGSDPGPEPTPAPSISSLNYDQGQIDGGGQSIVITGLNFTGATSVVFDATTASYVVDSDTQITATLPAHAAGTINVKVVTAGGDSNNASFEYWSPAQLSLTHWHRADSEWDGPPWAGEASAGTSSGRTFVTAGSDPTDGATVGGYEALSFTDAQSLRDITRTWENLVTDAAYSILVVFNATGAVAEDTVNRYEESAFYSDTGGGAYIGCGLGENAGSYYFSGYHFDIAYTGPSTLASLGVWNAGFSIFGGGNLRVSINAGAEATQVKDVILPGFTGNIRFNSYFGGGRGVPGDILETFVMDTEISAGNKTKTLKYLRQRYGEAFA